MKSFSNTKFSPFLTVTQQKSFLYTFNFIFFSSLIIYLQKYAQLFEQEKVGMIELPYLSEERLQKMGVPLGPRLRILQEAQISLCKDTTLCIL